MEKAPGNNKQESFVEKKRQEAFSDVCDALEVKLAKGIVKNFESGGRKYELTCPEDCMVAFAQMMQAEIKSLYEEVAIIQLLPHASKRIFHP